MRGMVSFHDLIGGACSLAVIGLGYVGLPLAVAFDEVFPVIGFDLNEEKIQDYKNGIDRTEEVGADALRHCGINFTSDAAELKKAGFLVVAVPTPVHQDKLPDLSPILSACKIIGQNIRKGAVVVFESTVYPGVTEEICVPEIEKYSGFVCGQDFFIGYSPERINPGDNVHRLRNIVKIVSGMNTETRDLISLVYGSIINKETGGEVYPAESIRVAEAAKLAENTQRDVNIALMNELAMAFNRMNIQTVDVINAMNTKWNALHFYPGLVGGHCIGVDPYYFIQAAEKKGYHSSIVTAGRRINDDMPEYIARETIRQLLLFAHGSQQWNIFILGMTFKGNCPDLRNTKSAELKSALESYGIPCRICDPVANPQELEKMFRQKPVSLNDIVDADCLVFAADHREFKSLQPEDLVKMLRPEGPRLIVDIRNLFNRAAIEKAGLTYWGL